MSIDAWMNTAKGMLNASDKEWAVCRKSLEDSVNQVPLESGEEPTIALWASADDPKIGSKEDLILVASNRRFVLARAGTWSVSEWFYWGTHGAIRSVSITGWQFQQSDGWGNHRSNTYLRIDFMTRQLDSFSIYEQFDQPKELLRMARFIAAIGQGGAEITNSSQEFLMAYEALFS